MNTSTKIFLLEATDKLQNITGASRLRFQQARLDHTEELLLLYVTLVEQTNRFCKFSLILDTLSKKKKL